MAGWETRRQNQKKRDSLIRAQAIRDAAKIVGKVMRGDDADHAVKVLQRMAEKIESLKAEELP